MAARGARWLGSRAAWIPGLLLAVAFLFLGIGEDGETRWWALPLLPSRVVDAGSGQVDLVALATWLVTAAIEVTAVALYAIKDSRAEQVGFVA